MSRTTKHIHHILPVRLGGTEDESNKVELTVEQHAEAHRRLYEQHGKTEDLQAWKGLAALVGKDEEVYEARRATTTARNSRDIAAGTHNFQGDRNPSRRKVAAGTHHWQAHNGHSARQAVDERQRELVRDGEHHWLSAEHAAEVGARSKRLISEGKHPFGAKRTCPHCGKAGQGAAMTRWHFDNCRQRPHDDLEGL